MSKELEALGLLASRVQVGAYKEEMQKRFDIVKEALKRNESMKVILFDPSSYYGGLGYFKCPKCGEILTEGYYNYCPDCGQKLDWGEEKLREEKNEKDKKD